MPKKIITCIVTFFLVFSAIVQVFIYISKTTKLKEKKSYISKNNVAYIVKEYNGAVAVFSKGLLANNEQPIRVTEILTAGLPSKDRTMLKCGIEADNITELNELLEDLGS